MTEEENTEDRNLGSMTAGSGESNSMPLDFGEEKMGGFVIKPDCAVEKYGVSISFVAESGLKIRIKGPPNYLEDGDSWEVDEEEIEELVQKLNEIEEVRSAIITNAIEIEDKLDSIIKNMLFGSDLDKSKELFDLAFMESRNMSFFDKWKIFRIFSKEREKLGDSNLRSNIKDSINIRNRYAHSTIIFKDSEAYFDYEEGGKIKQEHLNEEKIKQQLNKIEETTKNLAELDHKVVEEDIDSFSGEET